MAVPESGDVWTSAIALLSTGSAGVVGLWRSIFHVKTRVSIVEIATEEHKEKLKRGSKKIADIHESVEVLAQKTEGLEKVFAERTQGLEGKIDEFGRGQKTILDHILRAKN